MERNQDERISKKTLELVRTIHHTPYTIHDQRLTPSFKSCHSAAKYKEYNKLKSLESSTNRETTTTATATARSRDTVKREENNNKNHQKKRKRTIQSGPEPEPDNEHLHFTSTPRKAPKGIFETPSKQKSPSRNIFPSNIDIHPSELDPYDSPSALRRLFSPSTHRQEDSSPLPLKTAVGPTPQRDGKVLGLFDLLSASGGSSTVTPTGANKRKSMTNAVSQRTPSKKKGTMDTIREEEENEEGGNDDDDDWKGNRSPVSYCLENLFATPTTRRYAAMMEDETVPFRNQSESQSQSQSNNPNINNKNDTKIGNNPNETTTTIESNETPFFLRRYNNNSTSNLSSQGPTLSPTAVRKPTPFVGKGLSVLVQGLREMEKEQTEDDWDVLKDIEEEQQRGKDEEAEDEDVQVGDSQVVEDGPSRPWKKKGQKRTTRLVKMKPVMSKPKQTKTVDDEKEKEEEEDDDDGNDDYEDDDEKRQPSRGKEDNDKSRGRKINPNAHANYRSMKINRKGPRRFGARGFRRR